MADLRYETLWRNKWITADARTIDDFIAMYEDRLAVLRNWKARGVLLDPEGCPDDYATFYTEDAALAAELGFEAPDWGDEDDYDEPSVLGDEAKADLASDVLGRRVDVAWIQQSAARFDLTGTESDLEQYLRDTELVFTALGGRSVEVADELDAVRVALAIRRAERDLAALQEPD